MDRLKEQSLFRCLTSGNVRRFVQEGGNINCRLHNGRTPLHCATMLHQVALVKQIIQSGADVDAQDEDGHTALHIAILEHNLRGGWFKKASAEKQSQRLSKLREIMSLLTSPCSLQIRSIGLQ